MRVSFDMNAFPTKPHPRWYCDNIWKPSKQLSLGSTIYLHSRNRGGENTSAVGSAKGGKFNTVSRLERSPYIYMITAWLAWSVEIRARECWHLAARWEKKRANRGGGGGSSGPSRARARAFVVQCVHSYFRLFSAEAVSLGVLCWEIELLKRVIMDLKWMSRFNF